MRTLKKLSALLLSAVILLSLILPASLNARAAEVTYAVEGGTLRFDTSTGTVFL